MKRMITASFEVFEFFLEMNKEYCLKRDSCVKDHSA